MTPSWLPSTDSSADDETAACRAPRARLALHPECGQELSGEMWCLRNISLEIAEGEFLTILGESGSGKTTLLRIIAGFETRVRARSGWAASGSTSILRTGGA